MTRLRIVITGDINYFPGIALTMASSLAFLDEGITPDFTILHERLDSRHQRSLLDLAKQMRPGATVELVDMGGANLPDAPTLHRLTFARLFAADLVKEDVFVYLDSDLLVLRDLAPLADSLSNEWIAASPRARRLGDDCPWLDPATMNPDDDYFCPGIMAVDRNKWMENEIPRRALDMAHREAEHYRNYDQTILNFLLYGKVNIVSASWGWNHWEFDKAPADEPLIIHYITGGKPWTLPSRHGVAGLWLSAFQLLCSKNFVATTFFLRLKALVFDIRTRLLGTLATGRLRPLAEKLAPGQSKSWAWTAAKASEAQSDTSRAGISACMQRLRESPAHLKKVDCGKILHCR